MSEDEKMQRLADLREKAIMDEKAIYAAGLDKGIAQGIEQGQMQTKIEIIKKLIKMNLSYEQIASITDLAIDEVKRITKSLN